MMRTMAHTTAHSSNASASHLSRAALFLAVAALLTTCGEPEEPPRTMPSNFADRALSYIDREFERGSPGGSLRLPISSWITSANPVLAVGGTADEQYLAAAFARPITRDAQTGEWVGQLASSFETGDSAIEITLRDDFHWSDGTPVTVEDALYSLNELYLNEAYPTSIQRSLFGPTADEDLGAVSVTQTGARSYRIAATRPSRGLYELASLPPLPKHVVSRWIDERGDAAFLSLWPSWTDPGTIVSSGPFVVTQLIPGERVLLERNDSYPLTDEAAQALPYLDSVELVHVTPETEVAALAADLVDVVSLSARALEEGLEQLPGDVRLYADDTESPGTFVAFNMNPLGDDGRGVPEPLRGLLSDLRFREIVAALIDRQALIESELSGLGAAQISHLGPSSPYALEDPAALISQLEMTEIESAARALQQEYPEAIAAPLEVLVNAGNELRITFAERLAGALSELGFSAEIRIEPFAYLTEQIYTEFGWQIIVLGMERAADPRAFAQVLPSWGLLHIPEPNQERPRREWEQQLDRLWIDSRATLDEQRYTELQAQMQTLLIEELPWINVAGPLTYYVAAKPIGSLMSNAFDLSTFPVERLFLAPEVTEEAP